MDPVLSVPMIESQAGGEAMERWILILQSGTCRDRNFPAPWRQVGVYRAIWELRVPEVARSKPAMNHDRRFGRSALLAALLSWPATTVSLAYDEVAVHMTLR